MKKFLFPVIFSCSLFVGCADEPKQYALSTAHPLATETGAAILEGGGNAFDAAVAVSAVLAVVEPYSSGFGGGGFWLLHQADYNRDIMIDGRERAPMRAHRDMYLDDNGNVIGNKSLNGALAAGIPGMAAALVHIAEKYGTMPLEKVLEPAIAYAESGFPADKKLIQYLKTRQKLLKATPATKQIFLPNGKMPTPGQLIRQLDLGGAIHRLAEQGKDGFYQGRTAELLVKAVTDAGGIWTLDDLADYAVVEREPIHFHYQNAAITSASLPSSGGILLAQILNILSEINLPAVEENDRIHYLVEAMRHAYRDRAQWLGDADFVKVPQEQLLSRDYARMLATHINPTKAYDSENIGELQADIERYLTNAGEDTTHFSIIDGDGNRVAATLSINYLFGSGFVAEGTGVLLNNEMDDFSIKPGAPNIYGLVGGDANAIEAGKRMLSSMSPTFVEYDDRVAVLGTPGGSRIITMVLLGILNFIGGASAEEIVSFKRFHHQYLPNVIQYEKDAISLAAQANLHFKEHQLEQRDDYGNMQVVIYDHETGQFDAAADSRGIGAAKIGVINIEKDKNRPLDISP